MALEARSEILILRRQNLFSPRNSFYETLKTY